MKKIICLALASIMLIASLPATFAEEGELTLDPNSSLVIEDGYIENLPADCTAAELLAEFADKDNVTITDKDGNPLGLSDKVGAATVTYGSTSVKTYLMGDANSDSGISTKDVSFMLKKQAGFASEINEKASDVNNDGTVNAKDVAQILKFLAGWDVVLQGKSYAGIAAENEDAAIDYGFDTVMKRVGRSNTSLDGRRKDYVARMAKNELEDIQLLITATEDRNDLTLTVSPLTNANGAELKYEMLAGYYYDMGIFKKLEGADYSSENTDSDYFPEPLPEYRGEAFNIAKDNSKAFMMRVNSDADTEAGLYKATAILKDAAGKELKKMEFRVYVWNIVLPVKPSSDTAFSLDYMSILLDQGDLDYINHVMTEEDRIAVYERWYEYMLDQRISAYKLPVDITSPEADKWMSDPRVTSFCTNGGGQHNGESAISKEAFQAIYDKLKGNEDWLYKAYVYTLDEPCDDGVGWAKGQYDWVHEWVPDVETHICVPMASNQMRSWNDEPVMDTAAYLMQYSDIICPQSYFFTTYYSMEEYKLDKSVKPKGTNDSATTRQVFEKYGQFAYRWEQWREEGKRMWWYVCCSPTMPHANFFSYYQGVCTRVLMWQQYMFDVDGLLYYSTIRWNQVSKRRLDLSEGGDGLLLYTGSTFGQESYPVSSVRLEQIRDGLEDFDYLTMLEEKIGRREVMKFVENVTTDVLKYTEDADQLASVRDEVGFYLESLSK